MPVSMRFSARSRPAPGRWLALALVAVAAVACTSDPDSQRGVAERFLDAHYVKIDLAEAQTLTAGLAEKKVREERRLVAGQAIDDTTYQPSVYYRFLEEHPDGADRSRMVYHATFSVSGTPEIERRILLVLRRDSGGWKVVNFEEFE